MRDADEIFSIIVPAYNEKTAIQDVLRRCLAAKAVIENAGLGIGEVETVVVDDGSGDNTGELARKVSGVRVITHPVNRGYGAAIKTGFQEARGAWLGFLDADGTCDPEFFKDLLAEAKKNKLDVALGSRMHAESKMPAMRVIGNWAFRTLLNAIGGAQVTDIASGMRVLRRESLTRLFPLPDGMHFTPAMSARAILDPGLRIGEIPMSYEERVGRSKLSVVKDGFRFLRVILETAIIYRPLVFFCFAAGLCAMVAGAFLTLRLGGPTAPPLQFYFERRHIEDWMLYRLILVSVLLTISVFLAALGFVAQALVGLINHETEMFGHQPPWARVFMARFVFCGVLSLIAALAINTRPLVSYIATGSIPGSFWVFPVAGALFTIVGVELLAFSLMVRIARLLWERETFRSQGKNAAKSA